MHLFLFPLQHMKRRALQNKQLVVLRMAFLARKVLGTFEKRAPGVCLAFGIIHVSQLKTIRLNLRYQILDF